MDGNDRVLEPFKDSVTIVPGADDAGNEVDDPEGGGHQQEIPGVAVAVAPVEIIPDHMCSPFQMAHATTSTAPMMMTHAINR